MNQDLPSHDWTATRLKPGAELWRTERFSYRMQGREFAIELFTSSEGSHYAIGTPADVDVIIVYGSQVVGSAQLALEQAIKKIDRDLLDLAITEVGEDKT